MPAGTTSTSDVVTFAGSASPEAITDFFADPKPITFELSNPTITANAGTPFTDISTAVNSKDATLVVDYGGHTPAGKSRVRTYQVAAGVEKQRVGGEIVNAGITPTAALKRLRLAPRYAGGKLVSLNGVDNNSADPNDGTWIAVGSAVGLGDDKVDFADVRVTSGSGEDDHGALLLTYVDDRDGDGLSSLTEPLQGTTETGADTDHDGLTDQFETECRLDRSTDLQGRQADAVLQGALQPADV